VRKADDRKTGKDLEEKARSPNEIIHNHFPGVTEGKPDNLPSQQPVPFPRSEM
jgi:hypothetical protein